jgi:outer membrane protein assembly factor BamB
VSKALFVFSGILGGFAFAFGPNCAGETHQDQPINTFRIPEDGQSYTTEGLMGIPSMLLADDTLLYQDGLSGPLRAFDTKTLKERWSWPSPREYPAYYLWDVIRSFPVTWPPDSNDHLYEWSICLLDVDKGIIKVCAYNPRTGDTFICGVDILTGKSECISAWLLGGDYSKKPIVVDDLIIPAMGNLRGYSLKSNKVKWQIKYDCEKAKIVQHTIDSTRAETEPNSHPLIWGVDDRIYCIDALTGRILWMEIPIQGLRPECGYADSDEHFGYEVVEPVNDIVCFKHETKNGPSVLLAFNVKKRILLWQCRHDYYSYFSFVHDKGEVIAVRSGPAGESVIICLDAITGKVKWERTLYCSWISRLTASNRIIYCCVPKRVNRDQGGIYAINRITGEITWEYKSSEYFIGNPVLYKDKLYVLSTKNERSHDSTIRVFDHKSASETIKKAF